MLAIGTWNSQTVYALPSDVGDAMVYACSELEWEKVDVVSRSKNPFTGSVDVFDWQAAWWVGTISFAAMTDYSQRAWTPLFGRGGVTLFQAGDPVRLLPLGVVTPVTQAQALAYIANPSLSPLPAYAPLVTLSGSGGYTLNVRGLQPGTSNVFQSGDLIQVGWRVYEAQSAANTDSSGHAALSIWPPLRNNGTTDTVTDGQPIITSSPRGIFRLSKSSGNKFSSTVSNLQGLGALAIEEAL